MSIDATVMGMAQLADGTMRLTLEQPDGSRCAGRGTLTVVDPPSNLAILIGRAVWGGDESLMCGEIKIGKRDGYSAVRISYDALIAVASRGPDPVIHPREIMEFNK